jgi:transposase InsO family protein
VGKIGSKRISSQVKQEILESIESAKAEGISVKRSCSILMINRQRIIRWQNRFKAGLGLEDIKPGPSKASHRLLPSEREQVLDLAKHEKYADLSHRILAVTAWEMNLFYVSFSSVYRILKGEGMMGHRGHNRRHNGNSKAPERKELTGPNQRWCWDISYLHTHEKGRFLYLYLLLDEYSRKSISWIVSWSQDARTAKLLLDMGLLNENIIDLPEGERPEVINDRGRQMKAKSVRQMLEDHKMPQMFSRPRTPNDNPFIESAFSTVKSAPGYPGRFLDLAEAVRYFESYYRWYNEQHYHSGIDYVTPDQAHQGLRESIVQERNRKLSQHRQWRKNVNSGLVMDPQEVQKQLLKPINQSEPCSIIRL